MKKLFVLMVLTGLLANLSQASAKPPLAYEGMRLYVSYCQLCHGPTGDGDGPLAKKMNITPANLTTTLRSRSDTILKKIITGEGRQTITGRDRHNLLNDAMPKWSNIFNESEVDALIAFLRFLSTSKHALAGDPEVGQRVYGKYCSVCHGEDGEGDGVMTTLMSIYPSDHTNPNEMNLLDNALLADIIEQGRGQYMPAWRGVLNDWEIKSLISYIRLLAVM